MAQAAPSAADALRDARRRAAERRALAVVGGVESVEGGAAPASHLGSIEPRLWTPPLRELTPETSVGFEQIAFAKEHLGRTPHPWQEWLMVHAGELLPDGRPRFRIVIVLVARQNGKTEVPVMLSCYWTFHDGVPLILGTSTKLSYAQESWEKAIKLAKASESLGPALPPDRQWIRRTNGSVGWDFEDSRYTIAPADAEGGRSLTIHRLVMDELRQHRTYAAWDAAVPAMGAVPDAQAWALSNAGDDGSVVLNEKREEALRFIDTGEGDPRVGLFEWSAPPGSDPTDPVALGQANPQMGRTKDVAVLVAQGRAAKAQGGESLAGFYTEEMCIRVPSMDPAVDPDGWTACLDPGTLEELKRKTAFCIDLSLDQQHATLAAAAVLDDGRVRVEVVRDWQGPTATKDLRRELPALVTKVKPAALVWMPNGPAAAVAADLAENRQRQWPPPGVRFEAIRGDTASACMGLAEVVSSSTLVHSGQELLDAHVLTAERSWRGDVWVFTRKGEGYVDAAFAAAGAVHAARTMPAGLGKPRIVTARSRG